MPFRSLIEDLEARREQNLLRHRRRLDSPQGARARVDGRDLLTFCSNDYLGLANDPRLIAAARDGLERYGLGAGASHLITGHSQAHETLEAQLAEFVGMPRALLFSTGYMANLGAVTALVGRGDQIFADKLNHASLYDACTLSRADLVRYPHGDLTLLEQRLSESVARRKLVITDSVFSMDGDIAPLPELLALCERYRAWLLVDDAHGFGVLGTQGRGCLQHFQIKGGPVIYMGTLGKAAGVAGAFVAGPDEVVETLVQGARSYIYTTASPPALSVALSKSLEIIAQESWRRDHLGALIDRLRRGLSGCTWPLMPSGTPIQPVLVGDNAEALRISDQLLAQGILVPAIRPPTVPKGSARLRISLSASHSEADVGELIQALDRIHS